MLCEQLRRSAAAACVPRGAREPPSAWPTANPAGSPRWRWSTRRPMASTPSSSSCTTPTGIKRRRLRFDSTGAHKSVPNNCLACHGLKSSAFPLWGPVDRRRLPGDPVPPIRPLLLLDYRSESDSLAQQENFRKLNVLVALTPMTRRRPNSSSGGSTAGSFPRTPPQSLPIPSSPAWNTTKADRTIYEGVIKPHCRGCHMTSTDTNLDFDSPADFTLYSGHLAPCDSFHGMPHAEQGLRNFWTAARAHT